ncbi:MAG: TPM domain-containing protein [Candidatus Paceibacterota bacterium]|jgi:uncharacterized protein
MKTHFSYPEVIVSLFSRVLVFFVIPVFFVSAYTSPGKPASEVNDFAGILSTAERSALEVEVREFQRPAGLEMAIVTVPTLGGDTIENYAVRLFEEWGIGQKLKDNGILLLVAPTEREVRIEVGYGLEPYLTDAESSYIIRTVITPAFKSGDYAGGMRSAVDAIEGAVNADPSDIQAEPEAANLGIDIETVFIIFFVLVMQVLPVMMYSKSWWLGGVVGFILGLIIWSIYVGAAFAVAGLILDYILSKKYGGKMPHGRGSGGIFFGGGGLGGRGGGGFGGFGGGMSGGGGASGRW